MTSRGTPPVGDATGAPVLTLRVWGASALEPERSTRGVSSPLLG